MQTMGQPVSYGTGSAPGAASVGQPQLPQIGSYPDTYNAWPNISPYDNKFSQHYNAKGLWYHDWNNKRRSYFFNADALVSKFKDPEELLIGDSRVAFFPQLQPFFPVDGGVFHSTTVAPAGIDEFAVERQSELDPISPGVRLNWGFFDPDDSGFELVGYWLSDSEHLFKRGLDQTDGNFLNSRITAGLPLFDGTELGTIVGFDQLLGAEMNRILTPRFRFGPFDFRPILGLRYMYIRERFTFNGRDSGLAPLQFNPDGTIDPSVLPDMDSSVPPFSSFLNSSVRSHLAGPQIGIRNDFGGEFIHVTSQGMFGILFNREDLELDGGGIGDGFSPTFDPDKEFHQQDDHLHVSPMLEYSITAELAVFKFIPMLRRINALESARLRAGYRITGVFEVARPNDTIEFNGQPLEPRILNNRSKFYVQGFHFGFNWNY